MWGKKLHVSKVVGKYTSAVEIKLIINVSLKHTNFHSSVTEEYLVEMIDFDVSETVYSVLDPTKPLATMARTHHNSTTGPGKYRPIERCSISR